MKLKKALVIGGGILLVYTIGKCAGMNKLAKAFRNELAKKQVFLDRVVYDLSKDSIEIKFSELHYNPKWSINNRD